MDRSDQMAIFKDQNIQTNVTVVGVAYCLWLPFLISSAQLNKVKERNFRSVCGQQLFRSLGAHQHSSDQMKMLKEQSAKTAAKVVSVTYVSVT